MRVEIAESRRVIAERLDVPVRHFAYPFGDPSSAGQREFEIAAECGFSSAVTTRKGMLFADQQDRLMALPRLSINGIWQKQASVESLLTGTPFYLARVAGRRAA